MNDYTRGTDKLAGLRAAHRATRDKREADRIKAVVLLATGWSAEQVAEVLQLDATRCGIISGATNKVASRPLGHRLSRQCLWAR